MVCRSLTCQASVRVARIQSIGHHGINVLCEFKDARTGRLTPEQVILLASYNGQVYIATDADGVIAAMNKAVRGQRYDNRDEWLGR